MTSRARGMAEMAIAMTLSGTIGWFVLKSGATVGEVVFWRCLFGALVLGAACVAGGLSPRDLTARQIGLAVGSGVAIVVNWLLLFGAFARIGIATATILYNVQPFLLVLLGRVVLGEALTRAKLFWLAAGFTGLAMAIFGGTSHSGGSGQLVGIVMALGAAGCWAAAALQTKLLHDVPPRLIALVHMFVGMAILAPIGLRSPDAAWPMGWAMLLTLGVVHTGLVYLLMYAAIHRLPTALQGALSYLNPAAAILVDVLAFGHRAAWEEVVGIAVILGAAGGMAGWHRPFLRRILPRANASNSMKGKSEQCH